MFELNIEGVRKLFEMYFEPRKRYMNLKNSMDLYSVKTNLFSLPSDVTYCYGMSKMTVVQETKSHYQGYFRMNFSEFLESIGRVAHHLYAPTPQNPDYGELTLVNKIEYVLDDLLALLGMKRRDPTNDDGDISESDDDY